MTALSKAEVKERGKLPGVDYVNPVSPAHSAEVFCEHTQPRFFLLTLGRLCSLPPNLLKCENWVSFRGIKCIEKPKLISSRQHVTKPHITL